ncbi:MAG: hypothetical protein AVDCRST_MAG35-2944, partial [uncultured Quadrisphaera sp.]
GRGHPPPVATTGGGAWRWRPGEGRGRARPPTTPDAGDVDHSARPVPVTPPPRTCGTQARRASCRRRASPERRRPWPAPTWTPAGRLGRPRSSTSTPTDARAVRRQAM